MSETRKIEQPKSYNPETVQAGQTWAEKGDNGAVFTVETVGKAGARANFGGTTVYTIGFDYFAHYVLVEVA